VAYRTQGAIPSALHVDLTPGGGIRIDGERSDVRDLVVRDNQRLNRIERDIDAIAGNVRTLSEHVTAQQGADKAAKNRAEWLRPIVAGAVLLLVGWVTAHLTMAAPAPAASTDEITRAVLHALEQKGTP
jgi:hypothetical protein